MAFNLFQEVNKQLSETGIDQHSDLPDFPQEVKSFLGNLGMLQGIPIHYLVPNEHFLPKTLLVGEAEPIEQGSIRVFMLDTEWIACLFDGALSVVEKEYREVLMAKAMAGNYVADVFYQKTKEQIKKQIMGTYTPEDFDTEIGKRLIDRGITLTAEKQAIPTTAQNNWCYTGFFIRSEFIASWVGIEVVAKGKDTHSGEIRALQVIRLERLAADTLFCICEGLITEIDIVQPAEGIHFDCETTNNLDCFNEGILDVTKLKAKGVGHASEFAKAFLSKPVTVKLEVTWSK